MHVKPLIISAGTQLIIPCDRGRTSEREDDKLVAEKTAAADSRKAAAAKPAAAAQWTVNGNFFRDDSSFVAGNGSLVISRLKPFHQGTNNNY